MFCVILSQFSWGRKTSKTQCLHGLCVEIDPPTPKTLLKMRRCYADSIFSSGRRFFTKSMHFFEKYDVVFEKSLNPCQPSWFAVVCEATKRQKLNVCMDFVLKLSHPRPKHFLKRSAAMRIRCFHQGADFSQNRCNVLKNVMLFLKNRKIHARNMLLQWSGQEVSIWLFLYLWDQARGSPKETSREQKQSYDLRCFGDFFNTLTKQPFLQGPQARDMHYTKHVYRSGGMRGAFH